MGRGEAGPPGVVEGGLNTKQPESSLSSPAVPWRPGRGRRTQEVRAELRGCGRQAAEMAEAPEMAEAAETAEAAPRSRVAADSGPGRPRGLFSLLTILISHFPQRTRVAEGENHFRLIHKGFCFVLFSCWNRRPPLNVLFPEVQRFSLISGFFEVLQQSKAKRNPAC